MDSTGSSIADEKALPQATLDKDASRKARKLILRTIGHSSAKAAIYILLAYSWPFINLPRSQSFASRPWLLGLWSCGCCLHIAICINEVQSKYKSSPAGPASLYRWLFELHYEPLSLLNLGLNITGIWDAAWKNHPKVVQSLLWCYMAFVYVNIMINTWIVWKEAKKREKEAETLPGRAI